MVKRALHPPAFSHLMSGPGPGCVKTPTSNFRVEILSRLRWIGKELLCQSSPKEEKGENNSAHSLLAHVFTQPQSLTDVPPIQSPIAMALELPRDCQAYRQRLDRMQHPVHHSGLADSSRGGRYSG